MSDSLKEPSREVWRKLFLAAFPEPPRPRLFSWKWFIGDTEYQRWLHADFTFHRMFAQKQWGGLTWWLLGLTERDALNLAAASLRARTEEKGHNNGE